MALTEGQAITMLRTRPVEFLSKHSVMPGALTGVGAREFRMIDTGRTIDRPSTIFGGFRSKQGQHFKVNPFGQEGGTPFQAWQIPLQRGNVPMTLATLPNIRGAIMITSQMTHCSFVIERTGGTCRVAHVQPTGGENGVDLQRRLTQRGRTVYGLASYQNNGMYATLVGVCNGWGRWEFFRQNLQGRNVTSAGQLAT